MDKTTEKKLIVVGNVVEFSLIVIALGACYVVVKTIPWVKIIGIVNSFVN